MPQIRRTAPADTLSEALLQRVRAEFREMPGLCLTLQQACRLWHVDTMTCTRILEALVEESFLKRSGAGAFIAEDGVRRH